MSRNLPARGSAQWSASTIQVNDQQSNIPIEEHDLVLDLKYDNLRQFYVRFPLGDIEGRPLPLVFINVVRRKKYIECQTLDMVKQNQRVHIVHS